MVRLFFLSPTQPREKTDMYLHTDAIKKHNLHYHLHVRYNSKIREQDISENIRLQPSKQFKIS